MLVLLLWRCDVLMVVRRLRSANSVRSEMKTREGRDYKCKRSSHLAARASIKQRRAARLPKLRKSRIDRGLHEHRAKPPCFHFIL